MCYNKEIKIGKIKLDKYLLKVNKLYPKEMTKDMINELLLIQKNKPDKLLIEFLNELHGKKVFDQTCHLFYVYYE